MESPLQWGGPVTALKGKDMLIVRERRTLFNGNVCTLGEKTPGLFDVPPDKKGIIGGKGGVEGGTRNSWQVRNRLEKRDGRICGGQRGWIPL